MTIADVLSDAVAGLDLYGEAEVAKFPSGLGTRIRLVRAQMDALRRDLDALDNPFAPPTSCPLCSPPHRADCHACKGTGVFIREGIFVAHHCSRCRDGAAPERCPTLTPGNCGEPMARND